MIDVRCSWCGLTWTKPGDMESGGVSDGICEPCLAAHFPETAACSTVVGDEEERAA